MSSKSTAFFDETKVLTFGFVSRSNASPEHATDFPVLVYHTWDKEDKVIKPLIFKCATISILKSLIEQSP